MSILKSVKENVLKALCVNMKKLDAGDAFGCDGKLFLPFDKITIGYENGLNVMRFYWKDVQVYENYVNVAFLNSNSQTFVIQNIIACTELKESA